MCGYYCTQLDLLAHGLPNSSKCAMMAQYMGPNVHYVGIERVQTYILVVHRLQREQLVLGVHHVADSICDCNWTSGYGKTA